MLPEVVTCHSRLTDKIRVGLASLFVEPWRDAVSGAQKLGPVLARAAPLKEAGVDSLIIKELMGHESLATTAIYVQVPLKLQCSAVNLLPTLD